MTADGGQREQLAAWEAALVGSGLPIAGLDAPKPRPRFAQGAPLAASIPGEQELADVWLVERVPQWRAREALLPVMPDGFRLVDLYDVWLGEAALPGRVVASVYRATMAGPAVELGLVRAAVRSLLDATVLPRERRKGDAVVAYDLRAFIDGIEVEGIPEDAPEGAPGDVVVRMVLRHDPEKGIGRPEELLACLGDVLAAPLVVTGLVRERLVLADPAPPPPGPRQPTRTRQPSSRRSPSSPR